MDDCNLLAVPAIPDATAGADRGVDRPLTPGPRHAQRHHIVSSMDKGKGGDCFRCRLRHQVKPAGALWHGNRFFGRCSDLVLKDTRLIDLHYLESLNTWIERVQCSCCCCVDPLGEIVRG